MLVKNRVKSMELLTLRSLNLRIALTEQEKRLYTNLENGYCGEVLFDQLTISWEDHFHVLNDLLFEVNHSYFQIDKLLIAGGIIHIFDVKYFQGEWYFDQDKLYLASNKREYKNPVDQLKRCVTLFNQLLSSLKQNNLVEAQVVFVNPEFTLFQAPMNLPILLPTQIDRFITQLTASLPKITEEDRKLAQKFLALHHPSNPFITLPNYTYEQLKKGANCENCQSFSISVEGRNCTCRDCQYTEPTASVVLRSVEEFRLLFPTEKITTNIIHDWCRVVKSKKMVSKILRKNFTTVGSHQWAYYD